MDVDGFCLCVETLLKRCLSSLATFKMRASDGSLLMSFVNQNDFAIAVMAATGANIKLEVVSNFSGKNDVERPMDSCILILDLVEGCLDIRVVYFMYEVLLMKFSDGSIGSDLYESERQELRAYESWLEASP